MLNARTGGSAQDLLGATVDSVDAPGIGVEGHAPEGAHSVHEQQGPVLMAQLA